jgi:uncharacterized OsmC-like protein
MICLQKFKIFLQELPLLRAELWTISRVYGAYLIFKQPAMKVTASVKNSFNCHEVVVATNQVQKSISIPSRPSGYGSSLNGAELLLLSIATCYCNDIYREAAKRNLVVRSVQVECYGEFGSDGQPGTKFSYRPVIESDEPPESIRELVAATDEIAEIHKTLRQGIEIKLEV